MFFFARPPSCAGFTRLLTFRVTRKSQPPQRPKISPRLAADIIRSDHPTRPDTSFQFLRPFTWHNPSGITLLRTLRRYEKRQLLCNQANPNSLCKIPGVGVPLRQLRVLCVSLPRAAKGALSSAVAFLAPLFSCTYKSLLPPDRFRGPLFSYNYKPLFAQPLSLHIYTKRPGGGGSTSSYRVLC